MLSLFAPWSDETWTLLMLQNSLFSKNQSTLNWINSSETGIKSWNKSNRRLNLPKLLHKLTTTINSKFQSNHHEHHSHKKCTQCTHTRMSLNAPIRVSSHPSHWTLACKKGSQESHQELKNPILMPIMSSWKKNIHGFKLANLQHYNIDGISFRDWPFANNLV